jgi:cellulose biosynthesis protein BcsQ
MKTLAFFNNKGGVGKTTLLYHLAWMFSDMGRRVLVADFDPQANLTSMFLTETELEKLWDPDRPEAESVMAPSFVASEISVPLRCNGSHPTSV